MAIIKCKMCGGDLNLIEGASTAECEYCGSVQTVPKVDDEKKLTLFARANRLRAACEFDKAAGIYESIVADFPEEAEAYWGLVLCKYGIEYVDDPATGKKIPTCHRSSFDSLMDDSDFEQALENSDPVARKVYREEAKKIEEIRKGIIAVSSNEQPYDIFICYKETAENGDRTLDSVLAQDVYDALTDKGYRVFFSRITLEDKLGMEYEPYIFAALNSAKIMLAVGTDYEYYNAVWVKNEWSRYLKLMAKDKEKHLIPCFKGIDAYDMPKEFARLQAQDLGKVGAIQDLLRGIEKILPRQKEVVTQTVVQQSPTAPTTAPLLRRAQMFLEDANWVAADSYCEKVLDMDPENGQAYLLKLMATLKVKQFEEIKNCNIPFLDNPIYQKVLRFADADTKSALTQYAEQVHVYVEQARLDSLYKRTKKLMADAKTEEDFKKAAEQFETISHHADCADLAAECRKQATRIRKQALASKDITKHYKIEDGVIKEYIGDDTEIVIPDGFTGIADSAFWNCASATSIDIPESVEFIGEYAFNKCKNLREVTLNEGLKVIRKSAFNQCTALTTITIPASVEKIEKWAFVECENLETVVILGNHTVLENGVFMKCAKLRSVVLSEGVVSIGDSTFSGCVSLESITIPSSMEHIGDGVFSTCEKLEDILVEPGNPFYYMENRCLIDRRTKEVIYGFEDASIPTDGSVTAIGKSAFSNRKQLTSVEIPECVTSIGESAFSNCEMLQNIVIPKSVTDIGRSAFNKCRALTAIVIPNGVKRIGKYAFIGCGSLETIKIPMSVEQIGGGVFGACENLQSIIVENGNPNYKVTDGCLIDIHKKEIVVALPGAPIPDDGSIVSIGERAFEGDNNLQSITIPAIVEQISDYAFCKCENLSSICMSEGIRRIGQGAFDECKALTSATIPASMEEISKYAFYKCENLMAVCIPEGVKTIGGSAFAYCSALTSVTIPGSAERIGEWCFNSCKQLKTVTVQEGVKVIDKYAFYSCDSLESIHLPMSVTEISPDGFPKNCVIRAKTESYAKKWAEKNKLQWKEDEETLQIRRVEGWRTDGLCQHCGGALKGLFTKKCVDCGKPKDY